MGKTSSGPSGVQFHSVPYFFIRPPVRQNVLIGDDPLQVRFVEQLLERECVTTDRVSDEDLLGVDSVLFRVRLDSSLDITPGMRAHVGLWALQRIEPGSASANALVRVAATILGASLEAPRFDAIAKEMGRRFKRDDVRDMRVGMWQTCELILDGVVPTNKWKEPWDTSCPQDWLPPNVDPDFRLATLFKHLRVYTLLVSGADPDPKALGTTPSKIKYLQGLNLDPDKVYASLKVLSGHRYFGADSKKTVLTLVKVWST